jgi:hypothetical protein
MSRYGLDYYQEAYYGSSATSNYTAANFKAVPRTYGTIVVSWANDTSDWSLLKLTRNSYGYPTNPWDGIELDIKGDKSYVAFKQTAPTVFIDSVNLSVNTFYYYSLFIFQNKLNNWVRIGDTSSVSPQDYGYSTRLYDYLPDVYKKDSLTNPSSNLDNTDLQSFLSLFGFHLNTYKTYTNLLINRYDTEKIGGALIPAILQEFGLQHEPEVGFQQERILLKNTALVYKKRGSAGGLSDFIKSYTGYGVPGVSTSPNPATTGIVIGHNLMLDYNDSSFEESIGHWASPDGSASLYCLNNKNVTKLSLTSNVATLTLGAHPYQVGNKVYVSGSSLPLFNSTSSPVTITAISSTTISYALTGTDVSTLNAYNESTNAYPIVYPDPKAWNETTALTLYPNKQKGILAVKNANSSSGTVKFSCGSSNAITKGIPVTAGLAYTFTMYSVGSTARNVTVGIDWYNRFNVLLSSDTGSATSNLTGQFSTRLTVANKTAPTGAYYAVPTVSIASSAGSASNEWHYFDCAQFEQASSATSFDEARQLHITLKATRINEIINPNFYGTSPTPWTTTGGSASTIKSVTPPPSIVYNVSYLTLSSGLARLEATLTTDLVVGDLIYVSGVTGITNGSYTVTDWQAGANSYIAFNTGGSTTAGRTAATGTFYRTKNTLSVTSSSTAVNIKSWDGSTTSQQMGIYYPGTDYTFSVYSKGTSTSDTVTLSIVWYDSSHTVISTATGTTFNVASLTSGTTWDRFYVTGNAPATAAYATVNIAVGTTSGNLFYFNSALFENEGSVLTFFSGDGGPGRPTAFLWEGGVSNGARSHFYKNYATISNRLINGALADHLVLGMTAALYYAQPNT